MNTLELLEAYIATIVLHELIHYLVARAAGIQGLKLHVNLAQGIIGFRFSYAPLNALIAALLAPQAITVAAAALYASTGSIPALASALANLVGGIPDIMNAFEAAKLRTRYTALIATVEGIRLVA